MNLKNKNQIGVAIWLGISIILILFMIAIGGITRLTDSGLSMVNWNPIMGTIPPLSDSEWIKSFNEYKQFPEFKINNHKMTLSEFKFIFFWEYLHRMIARFLGLFFIIPFTYFLFKKRLDKKLNLKLGFIFFLGFCQALMGWYMVKSGLVDKPDISHFRLAAHFSLALILLISIFWTFLGLFKQDNSNNRSQRLFWKLIFISTFSQIIYGAFTAGLKAGHSYNTWPKMGDEWIPSSTTMLPTLFQNITLNPFMIQFIHRYLGYLAFALIITSIIYTISKSKKGLELHLIVFCLFLVQILLGIITLVSKVSLVPALMHQLNAVLLILGITYGLYFFRKRKV